MLTQPADLVMDVGNTRTKLALVADHGILRHGVVTNHDARAVLEFLAGHTPVAIVLGSVAHTTPAYLGSLIDIAPVVLINGDSPAPVRNAYGTKSSLGADRLANVVAASQFFAGRAMLVIDAGTCVTYDLVEANGVYAGGAITPGLRMRAAALHAYSARLPLAEPAGPPPVLGTSTMGSLEAGIHHGLVGEMREFIRLYGKERPGMGVVMTGGDAVRFARALESGIFALPFLTLEGYHALLVHHRSLYGGHLAADAAAHSGPGTG